ncbi:PaaI family thioesterase [Pseudomonas silvicola]|nr:PaaI family thioesterase [Pseudomonas silvicola]
MNMDTTLPQNAGFNALAPLESLDNYLAHLGIVGAPEVHEDGMSLSLRLRPIHMNGGASAHGGLLMTMMDVVMACSTHLRDNRMCVTVDLQTQFLRPGGGVGTLITARGRLRGGGRTLVFCDAQIHNEAGDLLAIGTGTFRFVGR